MSFSRFLLHGPNTSVIGMNAVLREIGGGDVNPDAASGLKLPEDGQGFYFNLHHFFGRIGLTVSFVAVRVADLPLIAEHGQGMPHKAAATRRRAVFYS